jgi:hypothetical protein
MCTALLETMSHTERETVPITLLHMQNKLSGEYEESEGAPLKRGDAVRGIRYSGPNYYNYCKSDCRSMVGC